MRTAVDVGYEVMNTLAGHAEDYDVSGILCDLRKVLPFDLRDGYSSIDTLSGHEYWAIVQKHERRHSREG